MKKKKKTTKSFQKNVFIKKKQSGIERSLLDKLDLRDFTLVSFSLRPPGEEFQLALGKGWRVKSKSCYKVFKAEVAYTSQPGKLGYTVISSRLSGSLGETRVLKPHL